MSGRVNKSSSNNNQEQTNPGVGYARTKRSNGENNTKQNKFKDDIGTIVGGKAPDRGNGVELQVSPVE